jgi:hypothetical protein
VLCANGNAITWAAADVPSLTCARLTTAAEGGTAGGGFALSGSTAVAITADLTAGTTTCLTSTHTGTGANAVAVTGNVTGGSGQYAYGANNNNTGTLTINGNVTGGSGSYAYGARNNTGTLTINGNVTGGSVSGAHGAWNTGTGTITITGAVTGGSGTWAYGALNGSTGTLTINGNVIGGSATGADGAWNSSTGAITINGTVAASSTARAFGVYNNSTGVITVVGSLVDTEYCSAYAGAIYWQPVAGVHYHKVFYSAGAARYYSPPLDRGNVRFTPAAPGDFPPDVGTTFAGFNSSGVAEYGTLVVPAEADVKSGEPYGAGGTEYTGSLVAGGGPLVGSGGLVG